ncbi:hypothetical protein G5B88_01000 [Herbaspirillum seropedicae]|uniref:Uncharacterized protein n=1 Tax=Herbaspirillum seropedicae (strain SmR1) TaxID=757424 RepID=D8IV07_HERSS|nr:hypothetical protein [Herbaspirillum seropedicae]ADJ61726.1 hypothetical protein Hsero_0200 [Herbaspirillum seropedicae SmR1]AKN63934.1 hypothetical protein ACP92_00995 [Herbaspirillum seropedicae]NQE29305.1 hypothetical protein [Herbaspirillum seropedicae]UMU19842.1 hypothetical protein G5B88_01000 [Herbaspirillum seropedicae]
MRFSNTTKGFYPETEQYAQLPEDVIEVTAQQYERAMHLAAGERLEVVDGELVIVAAVAPDDEERQARALAAALEAVERMYEEHMARLLGWPTQAEKDSWALKLGIAHRIDAGQEPGITNEAFLEGAGLSTREARSEWAEKVLAKSSRHARAAGIAERLRKQSRTALQTAPSGTSLAAILQTHRTLAEQALTAFERDN